METVGPTSRPSSVAAGDFNGDGNADLAVLAKWEPGGVSVLLGNGDGTFQQDEATEGNFGSKSFIFSITLSTLSASMVTVKYVTANGTARAGKDYQATGGILTFAPGDTVKTIVVPVFGNTVRERNKGFFVLLSSPRNAKIFVGKGRGTITNDD